tara:strand:+ start:3160 stop:3489 length:330 start_codon:yes stop_codon:yes gene_type:complete
LLFFKDIKQEKLDDPDFRDYYHRECHICDTTMSVVGRFLKMGDRLPEVLKALDIPVEAFDALKDGDHCDPHMVARLCDRVGMDGRRVLGQCPRAAETGRNQMTEKGENR